MPNTCSDSKELQDLFDEAEMLMKKIELVYDDKYFAPASNELRYAFGHYLKYQNGNNEEDYTKAKNHIQRAIYDAKEFIATTFLERIKDFEKEYKSVAITAVVSDWICIRKKLNEINKQLSESKELKESMSLFNEMYVDLSDIVKTVEAAIPELDKMRRSDFLAKFIPIAIAIISILFSIFIASNTCWDSSGVLGFPARHINE
ncbi:MAG: hypothetical protein FWE23_08480 [Chitinivibrionia bacterium]|nr:hypothetical protein [Chitinivibrionia bacterium]